MAASGTLVLLLVSAEEGGSRFAAHIRRCPIRSLSPLTYSECCLWLHDFQESKSIELYRQEVKRKAKSECAAL